MPETTLDNMTDSNEAARVTASLSSIELEALEKVIKYYRAPSRSHAIRLAIIDIAEMALKKADGTGILE